jgi:hypothetical protein
LINILIYLFSISIFIFFELKFFVEEELDSRCEKFLLSVQSEEEIKIEIDFEVNDALNKLEELKIISEKDGFITALSLDQAFELL